MLKDKVNLNTLEVYAKYFQEYFNRIFKGSNKNIKIVLYPKVKSFCIFELIISEEKIKEQIEIKENIDSNYQLINEFNQTKSAINFRDNSFFIIKTREFKNWCPAIAKLDLEKVIYEMLFENGGE